jgi:hypothetical protein
MSEYWASLVRTVQATIAYRQANASKAINQHKDTCVRKIYAKNEQIMSKYWASLVSTVVQAAIAYLQANAYKA